MIPEDNVDIEPSIKGAHGRAWPVDIAATRQRVSVKPELDGTVAFWIVEATWAHMAWHSYAIIVVHLRPLAEPRETTFYVDGATHEIWVYALNPEHARGPMIKGQSLALLTPKNFAAQFIEISDDLACARVAKAVKMICDGELSPDTDFMRQWIALFGDNMVKDRPHREQRPPITKVI